ncbi:toxin-antitoxin system HicB family antitoxin [Mesorhizobium sp. CN5-321]|uniref:toxin-antitoxin system HicB family antitoxin n=1 Tax=Mesorhizobium hunchu TaxID=3157708 RepID=UPI0032B7FACF
MTEWTKMTLRLPEQVHAALVEDARERDTSLNQVIVDRLNRSLGGVYVSEAEANDGTILDRLTAIEQRLDKLEGHDSEMSEEQSASKTQGEMLRDLKSRLVTDRE